MATVATPSSSSVVSSDDDDERKLMEIAKESSISSKIALDCHIVHVNAAINNTIVTVSDAKGAVKNWASSGSVGFKGAKRSTTYAAQMAGTQAAKIAKENGIEEVRVQIKGMGSGRAPVLKGLQTGGLRILAVSDVTPVPHNGCRPKKARRL